MIAALLARPRGLDLDSTGRRPRSTATSSFPGEVTFWAACHSSKRRRLAASAARWEVPVAGPKAVALPAGSDELKDAEFVEFFRAEHKKLIRFVMAIGADGDEAAEIAQVTFVKAFEGWDEIRAPRAWIRRVAVNELTAARQAARRETPRATLPDTPVPVPVALAAELSEEARQVLAALRALPPGQRQVMAWIIDGFGAAEIARELGASPESVRQSHAKARKNLGRFYGQRKQR
jgi:RNA polymerase sigma factor (sigma-70 family)